MDMYINRWTFFPVLRFPFLEGCHENWFEARIFAINSMVTVVTSSSLFKRNCIILLSQSIDTSKCSAAKKML